MRILVIRSNPRSNGYTQRFTDLFVEGAAETGADIVDIRLSEKNIAPCLGCYHCWLSESGECVQKDDMGAVLREFIEADTVVCATPVYYYGLSSRMQAFLERAFPLTKAGLATTPSGLFRNKIRHPQKWNGKSIVFIAVAALRSMENFIPLKATCRLIAESLNMALGGVLIRPESHCTLFERSNPTGLKRVREAFVQAGRDVGCTGRVSDDVQDVTSITLSPDAHSFQQQSQVYWDNAKKMGMDALDPDLCVAKVARDPRLILNRMVTSVDANATARVEAVLQFDFADPELHVKVTIDRGTASIAEVETPDATLRICCQSDVWTAIAFGELDARDALSEGSIELHGDRSLFLRLPRYFRVAN
jgi:putative sterol carrier protein/putative NADPH-quinone reductase